MSVLPTAFHTAQQVRDMDRWAIERLGIPGYTLMTRAGEAALDLIVEAWPEARRLLVLCGSGNNAGDGYVVARLARAAGLEVTLASLSDPSRLGGDAARAHADFLAHGGQAREFDASLLPEADLVVDAMLGTGLDREVRGAYARCIDAVKAAARPVLALDVPSGLHADSGATMGRAVRADRTITFVGLKAGLVLGDGPDLVGMLSFAGLGVPQDAGGTATVMRRIDAADAARVLPRRRRAAHKGENGRVLVVGGGPGMPGAARLAAAAALRAGAGLVTVATRAEHVAAIVAGRPEIICHAIGSARELEALLAQTDVIALGPGLGRGEWSQAMFEAALAAGKPVVVDADGLNLLAAGQRRRDDWILTPHPGEAARLLGRSPAEVQADRLGSVRALVDRFGGVAVLKGAASLVLGPSGLPWVCTAGNPGMATAGMGDVLTGVVAAVWAQHRDAEAAAAVGVLVHAAAGDLAARGGERGLLATDVIDRLRECVNPA
jgi:hydroxyethylthiazole kinase-like uncharacterized protein yjeF